MTAPGEQGRASPMQRISSMLGVGTNSPARGNSPALAPIREPAAILERPEPLIVEAKVIDRYQSYDAWRAVTLCISAEGIDVTPLNDPTARVRVLFPSIKGVRKLEEHIIEFEWRIPAESTTARKTSFFCPNPVDPIRVKFTACVQYLMQQRKKAASEGAGSAAAKALESDKSPRSSTAGSSSTSTTTTAGSGILSFLFTGREETKGDAVTPPLPHIPDKAREPPAPSSAPSSGDLLDDVVRPISPKPVAAQGSKSALSALLNWGNDDGAASGSSSRGSSRRGATAGTPPPASQSEKPASEVPQQQRTSLVGTILKGWGEKKETPPPIDPKAFETLQKEAKDLEVALKEANQRHADAVQRLESLQHLDPILTAAEEKTALATKKIQEADARVAETESKVRNLEKALEEANKRVTEMSEEHAALQAKARNAEHLEARLQEVESKLATSEASLTTLQNHYDAAIPKLVASENRVRDAETRAIDASRKAKEANDEVIRLKALLRSAEETLEQQAQTIRMLEGRMDVATRLLKAAENNVAAAITAVPAAHTTPVASTPSPTTTSSTPPPTITPTTTKQEAESKPADATEAVVATTADTKAAEASAVPPADAAKPADAGTSAASGSTSEVPQPSDS